MIRRCTNGHAPVRLLSGQRCASCQRIRQRRRGTPEQLGYGQAHRAARAVLVASLPTYCGYGCGTLLTSPGEMVAAHVVDGDPDSDRIASCRTCNERAKRRYNGGNAPARSGVRQGPEQTAKGSVHGQNTSSVLP